MAQLIALLGAIAGLIWAVNSLGKAGVSLNPFAWWRRLQWAKQHGTKPLYRLRDPVEVAAVLLLGTAKCKGDVTATQKAKLREIYTGALKMPQAEADDMLVAATFMLRDEVYVVDNIERILGTTRRMLSAAQKASVLNLMEEMARVDGPANDEQRKLIDRTMEVLNRSD
jgi:uncharacterized tellurite resistance protein B-like protein